MSANGVNVFRYSALGLGILYGFYHQRTITAAQKAAAAKHEWEHKQSLIDKAKAEYAKTKLPTTARAASEVPVDPMDPKFDLEAYLNKTFAENP